MTCRETFSRCVPPYSQLHNLFSPHVSQSETAGLIIPEIDLELNPGTLGGRFTTLEGLLQQVYEELDEKVFARGDSSEAGVTDEMQKFLGNLKKVRLHLSR